MYTHVTDRVELWVYICNYVITNLPVIHEILSLLLKLCTHMLLTELNYGYICNYVITNLSVIHEILPLLLKLCTRMILTVNGAEPWAISSIMDC